MFAETAGKRVRNVRRRDWREGAHIAWKERGRVGRKWHKRGVETARECGG